jgi:hypothetical protein
VAIPARLRQRRWLAALFAVVVVAVGVTLLVTRPWSDAAAAQRVDIVAGGGTSDATSGPARSLRLPQITAMTVAPDGTLWAAGKSSSASQIVKISPNGQAVRTVVHPSDDNEITSLGVASDGTLWAVSGGGADTVYRFVDGRLTPAFAPFVADERDPADGSTVRSSDPQPGVTQIAFDPAGELTFFSPATDDHCVTLRRIARDGRISTLAGGNVESETTQGPNDTPANGTDSRRICLSLFDTFAYLGPDAVLVRTRAATFTIALRTGRTASLSSVRDNAPTTPAVGSKPRQHSAAVSALAMPLSGGYGEMCATGADTWFAVNPRTPHPDADGNPAAVSFPRSYDWHASSGATPAVTPGRGDAQIVLRVEHGKAEILTAIATGIACGTHDVYVSAPTSKGAGVIARVNGG